MFSTLGHFTPEGTNKQTNKNNNNNVVNGHGVLLSIMTSWPPYLLATSLANVTL